MRFVTCFVVAVAAGALYGCPRPCNTDFECGAQSYCDLAVSACTTDCYVDDDCYHPIGCEATDDGCAPIGTLCRDGRCVGDPTKGDIKIGVADDGWAASVGEGALFLVEDLQIGETGVGFDLDERCAPNCVDNILSPLAQHANPHLGQGIRGQSTRLLIEVAGVIDEYRGRDDAVTLKIYDASMRSDGAVLIQRTSIDENNQARVRVRARIRDHRLLTDDKFDMALTLSISGDQRPTVQFDRATVAMVLPAGLRRFENGVLGASIRASSLHAIENPYCRQAGPLCSAVFPASTLLDLVATSIARRPDIDVDGDGAECLIDTDGNQTIDLCCDELPSYAHCNITTCPNPVTAVSQDPSSCALSSQVADGYSIGMALSGEAVVPAGIGG